MRITYQGPGFNFVTIDTYPAGSEEVIRKIEFAIMRWQSLFRIPKYIVLGVNGYISLHDALGLKRINLIVYQGLELVVLDIPDFDPIVSGGTGFESLSIQNVRGERNRRSNEGEGAE